MDRNIKIIALGGLDEFGKACYVIEIEDDIYVFDAGVTLPDKLTPGIDYLIARFDYLIENKDRVRGYLISHGHDQVLGALPYFYRKVPAPVFCTSVTKFMIESFMEHNHLDFKINFQIVKSGDHKMISQHEVSFFAVSHNIPGALGFAVATDYGNIIYSGSFVILNSYEDAFSYDRTSLVNILAKRPTLMLLSDSCYSDRLGYTAPTHDITPLAEPYFRKSKGRIFAAVLAPDIYTIYKFVLLAIKYNKKIITYNDETKNICFGIIKSLNVTIPEKILGHRDDINRYPACDVLVLITGFFTRLFNSICLLANGQNDDKRFVLNSNDTFIYGSRPDNETEIAYTESLDELYKATVNKVVYFSKNSFCRMHPSQEDLKNLLNFTKPKYYLPVNGLYSKLITNAKMAVNMNIGLNYSNVFVIDNGGVIDIKDGIAKLSKDSVVAGDLYVDGTGLGKGNNQVMQERSQLSEQGVISLAAGISFVNKKISYGPNIKSKGLIYENEFEQINKDLTRLFTMTLNDEIVNKNNCDIESLKSITYDAIYRYIRRTTNRTPIILISLFEIN